MLGGVILFSNEAFLSGTKDQPFELIVFLPEADVFELQGANDSQLLLV